MAWNRTDDLDGTILGVEQTTIGHRGRAFVLDLSEENRRELDELLSKFLEVATEYGRMPEAPALPIPVGQDAPKKARRVRTRPARSAAAQTAANATRPSKVQTKASSAKTTSKPASAVADLDEKRASTKAGKTDFTAVRQWANENGFKVSDTGRVPVMVMNAYAQATQEG